MDSPHELLYSALATLVLAAHGLWILWVIFGAAFVSGRRWLRYLHLLSLAWGFTVQMFPVMCPFTWLEQALLRMAGRSPYEGGFIAHYLDRLIYPDIPMWVLTLATIVVIAVNLVLHVKLWRRESSANARP